MKETEKTIQCPVCGKTYVAEHEVCEVCNWQNDPVALYNRKIRGANKMTIDEAIAAYAKRCT